jgi:FKBP-type peptidyl-prolyl cis-trans isomerase
MFTTFASALLGAALFLLPAAPTQEQKPLPADGAPPVTTASGLVYSVLAEGAPDAPAPTIGDQVQVHYTGWLTDGTVFDDSRTGGEPASFRLGKVIEGWNEGLALMRPGARYKLTLPAELAYGDRARGEIPANSVLIFDVELLGVEPGPPTPTFAAPRAETSVTLANGLRYEVVREGAGRAATGDERVVVDFAFWNPAGRLLDWSGWEESGPIRCTPDQPPLPFFADLLPVLLPGSAVLAEVPATLSFGDQAMPGIEAGSATFWKLEARSIDYAPVVPSFQVPDPARGTETESGLLYEVLVPGAGAPGGSQKSVKLAFSYWLEDGTLVDTTHKSGRGPITAKGEQLLLPFMKELVGQMPAGSVWLVRVPAAQGFVGRQPPGVPPQATTIWRLELVEVLEPLAVPEFRVPNAEKAVVTASGLQIETLRPGTGAGIRRDQQARVHYAGWLAVDGKLFDSSYGRGEPSVFGVTQVIPGWTETLLTMTVGQSVLVRIPSRLAYGATGSPPNIPPDAELVFQVELLGVED